MKVNYLREFELQLTGDKKLQIEVIDAGDWLATEPPEPDQIIAGIFDVGDKLALIGSSKTRKSFFLQQMLLSIATGRPFLGFNVPRPRRIVHIQFEIQPGHFHRRHKRMCLAMGITASDLNGNLKIINARGLGLTGEAGIDKIREEIESYYPELVSFDPLYKLDDGGENDPQDRKRILNAFDALIEHTGSGLVYCHHDAKGSIGDREIQDRGAGSNVLARDYDAALILTPHASAPDAIVIESLLRNYRPQEPFAVEWFENEQTGGYQFNISEFLAADKKTSKNRHVSAPQPDLSAYLPMAEELLRDGPLPIKLFRETFKKKTALTNDRIKAFETWATFESDSPLETTHKLGRGTNDKRIGRRGIIPSDGRGS